MYMYCMSHCRHVSYSWFPFTSSWYFCTTSKTMKVKLEYELHCQFLLCCNRSDFSLIHSATVGTPCIIGVVMSTTCLYGWGLAMTRSRTSWLKQDCNIPEIFLAFMVLLVTLLHCFKLFYSCSGKFLNTPSWKNRNLHWHNCFFTWLHLSWPFV